MTFREVLAGVETLSICGDTELSGIAYDSRKVGPGILFVAMRGGSSDGNRYIEAVIRSGAAAVVSDSPDAVPTEGVPFALVSHGRQALARISANYFGHPASKLKLIGITGTNGKTTTTFLTEHLLRSAGREVAMIGTIEYHVGKRVLPAPHTTPEALELNATLAEALSADANEAVMEVSSHALEQGRVFGLHYDVAVFTNLTRDHLDYHGEMEAYFIAKRKLFEMNGAEPPRVAVLNTDDPYGVQLQDTARRSRSVALTYGIQSNAQVSAEDIRYGSTGTTFRLHLGQESARCQSRLVGAINVYNVLAATAAAYSRGCSLPQIAEAIATFERVPGRFEIVDRGQPFMVVVDYAHTDDALRNLTGIARQLIEEQRRHSKVITVFGCGGDRDRSKRSLMGRAAGEGSDFVVLTSDNPRSEDPEAIIADALPGLAATGTRYFSEPDRRKAIELALHEAQPGDIVLLAGKGHEKTQTTRVGVFPFDDVQVASQVLADLGFVHSSKTEGASVA